MHGHRRDVLNKEEVRLMGTASQEGTGVQHACSVCQESHGMQSTHDMVETSIGSKKR